MDIDGEPMGGNQVCRTLRRMQVTTGLPALLETRTAEGSPLARTVTWTRARPRR
jgi:hypothetical protein